MVGSPPLKEMLNPEPDKSLDCWMIRSMSSRVSIGSTCV
jgi:hypothetical protein